MTDWHPDPDQLVELALADLEPPEQERLAAHLAQCPSCRDAYAELSDGLQQALAATPAIAPSAGFSGRVVAAMSEARTPRINGRPRPRSWLLVAAAAVVGVLGGVGGTVAVLGSAPEQPPPVTSHRPVATDLVTSAGDVVGSAGVTTLSGRSYLLLNITAGRPGATYDCILVAADGTRTNGGRWTLTDEYGSGRASGSWLVPIATDPPASVELVARSGTVWSRAGF